MLHYSVLLVFACGVVVAAEVAPASAPAQPPAGLVGFNFYRRAMDARYDNTRRVFGGAKAELYEYAYACALLDVSRQAACSCTVLRPRWVLTAAHCLTADNAAYVNYNTASVAHGFGDEAVIQFHYRHPKYKVEWTDSGRGMEVSTLHHDVGLLRTHEQMLVKNAPPRDPTELRRFNPIEVRELIVRAYGFGVAPPNPTAPSPRAGEIADKAGGEQLMSVDLRLVSCGRETWYHCACGEAVSGAEGGACSGDSGGPLVYRGTQIAVTSMGPQHCTVGSGGTTSVFTTLYNYFDIINSTIEEKEHEVDMRIRMLRARSAAADPPVVSVAAAAAAAALVAVAAKTLLRAAELN